MRSYLKKFEKGYRPYTWDRDPDYCDYVLRRIMEEEGEDLKLEVKHYSDRAKPFLRGEGYHGSILGQTGSGKTTLLFDLEKRFMKNNILVIHRDDCGSSWIRILPDTPTNVYIPRGCNLKLISDKYTSLDYAIHHFDLKRVDELFWMIYDSDDLYHVILIFPFTSNMGVASEFWANFLTHLIVETARLPISQARKVCFSCDQLNDILRPRGKEINVKQANVRELFNRAIANLRKQKVTILSTTHRLMDITASARTEFSYTFIKKIKKWEIYDWLNRELILANNRTFFRLVADISRLPRNLYVLFDVNGFYDCIKYPNIPTLSQVGIDREFKGWIKEYGSEKTFDVIDMIIAIGKMKGLRFKDIAEICGKATSTIHHHYTHHILKNPALPEEIKLALKR